MQPSLTSIIEMLMWVAVFAGAQQSMVADFRIIILAMPFGLHFLPEFLLAGCMNPE